MPGEIVKNRQCLIAKIVSDTPATFSKERWRWLAAIGAVSALASMNGSLDFIKSMGLNVWFLGVGGTGTGKSESFRPVEYMLREVKDFPIINGNTTKAALLDYLEMQFSIGKQAGHPLRTLRSFGLILNDEWTDVMPMPDQELLSAFIKCWGDQAEWTEMRRHSKKAQIRLPRPTLSILAAIQPEKYRIIFPEASAAEGFARRTLVVYETKSEQVKRVNLLERQLGQGMAGDQVDKLKAYGDFARALWGSRINVTPGPGAPAVWGDFIEGRLGHPITHPRAQDWNTTREQYMAKIAAIFAIARHFDGKKLKPYFGDIEMNADDLLAGIDFIQWCEETLVGFYSTQIQDSQKSLWVEFREYMRKGPWTEAEIKSWFSNKVQAYQVQQYWKTAQDTKRIREAIGGEGVSIGTQKKYTFGRKKE